MKRISQEFLDCRLDRAIYKISAYRKLWTSCLIRKFGESGNFFDVLMEGAMYRDGRFIAETHRMNYN
jgi:hypothetical protein